MEEKYKRLQSIYHNNDTEVVRAQRIRDKLRVVLKIRNSSLYAPERLANLEREYELGNRLEGNRFVKPIALEQYDKESILVLADDAMNCLDSMIPPDGFELQKFFILAIEISSALQELHSQGVVHGDINPKNLITNSNLDCVKLIDFGLATSISEEVMGFEPPADLHGSIAYISPEQTGRVNKPVDSRSDLYSLGVTLYKLVTGQLPFDSEDPREIIYSHIAKTPIGVRARKQEIPQTVSMVIEKLLSKSPGQRYQTASGVIKDLHMLHNTWLDGLETDDFIPGKHDSSHGLSLQGKIYGRKNEIVKLLEGLEKCAQAGQVFLIEGAAGTGKTALVRQLYGPITARDGFFLSGKFDQSRKNIAYTALSEAFGDLVEQCSDKDGNKEHWTDIVQSSVGAFGQVLVDIVPRFRNLIGKQPEVALVSPIENVARRNLVFANLVRSVCDVGRPVIIFLDDLQWSDSATLSVLDAIAENIPSNLMLVLSYRENELSQDHQVTKFLEKIRSMACEVTQLLMKDLPFEAVYEWADELLPGGEKNKKLASLIMNKTEGNPLFIVSMLQQIIEKNLIIFDSQGTAQVRMDEIANLPAEQNVVGHLMRKIEDLDTKYLKFLTYASILGNRFSMDALDVFMQGSQSEYRQAIQAAVDAHLLIKSGNMLMFTHDRVQQAASEILDPKDIMRLHLKAGHNIKKALRRNHATKEQAEDFLDHFNAAEQIITDSKERVDLAVLNLDRAKQLKSNAAYQAAEGHFRHALSFMPDNPFDSNYKMALELFTEYGETLFLNLKYKEGQALFDDVIKHSRSPLDSAKVYEKQIVHYAAHNRAKTAMSIALHSLRSLGVKLPEKFLTMRTVLALSRVNIQLRDKTPQSLVELPKAEQPLVLAQMKLLSAASVAAYIGHPDYLPLVVLQMIKISIERGICSTSPFALMGYASLICAMGNTNTGYAYGKAALSLMEKLNSEDLEAKLPYMFGVFIQHFKEPGLRSIELFETAITKGLEIGDYEFASYAVNDIMYASFYFGKNIKSLILQYDKQHKILAGFSKERSILMAKFWHQLMLTMNDPTSDGVCISGSLVDEKTLLPLLEQRKDLTSLAICMIGKMQLAYMADDYKAANTARRKTQKLIKALLGTNFVPVFYFFSALTCTALCRADGKKRRLVRDAKRSLKKLKKWGMGAPENYLYKAQIVEAELMSIRAKNLQAIQLYEKAIANASRAGNLLDLGIAHERMGRHLLSRGLDRLGLDEISNAISVFHKWGALNKSKRLSREFGIPTPIVSKTLGSSGSDRSSIAINASLDVETLAQTIKSLSSDLEFEPVLATLLESVLKNSGATRVVYINYDQDKLKVIAQKRSSGEIEILDSVTAAQQEFALPMDLVEKCVSASCEYVLENTGEQVALSESTPVGCVLIIPMKRQGTVKGIIYLENNLMNDAFRQEHVQFLSLLAQQAAIAIENALMFENLNTERNFSSNIIRNAPSLICGISDEGITTFINPVVEKVTGYTKSDLIGKNWWDLLYPDKDDVQVRHLFERFSNGEVLDHEMTLTCKNGEKRTIAWTSLSIKHNESSNVEIIGFGNDISERKRVEEEKFKLEEQYRHSQKMEAVGRLAGGIAHDFNNVLCAITGNASLTLSDLSPDDPMRDSIEQIVKAADRAADLTKQLLAFSRKQVTEPKTISLGKLIENLRPMLIRLIGEDIILDFSTKKNNGLIYADPSQMEQIVLNLVVNARDAMPDGGNLFIETTDVVLTDEYCCQHHATRPGPHVLLVVSDTGHGMNSEVREKIFEPFFTTKQLGQGTGLGLATVFGAVNQNGGCIEVYSEPDEGSTFKIYFPTSDKPEFQPTPPEDYSTSNGGHETILVVEDEQIVINIAKNILEHLGYQVLTATSGMDAILVQKRHEGPIDLLLTDVVMPNMNGHELAQRITKFRPEIKVLYCSGYTENVIAHHGVLDDGIEFISKPYSTHTLAAKIRSLLDKEA